MKILHLTLKKRFFDMIASGEKTEEYRSFNSYWQKRLMYRDRYMYQDKYIGLNGYEFKHFDAIHFYNGGSAWLKYRNFLIECKGFEIGEAKPEWSDNWIGEVFKIKLGKIISK